MSTHVKGSRPGVRAAKTAENRRRAVTAAYELFCERGYETTKLTDVAQRAGVSVQTLYFAFGNKQQLLHEAFVMAVMGESRRPPEDQPWFGRLERARSGRAAFEAIVDGALDIFERVQPLLAAARATAGSEAGAVWSRQQAMRREAFRALLARVTRLAPLRRGLDPDHALDTMLVLLGPEVYQLQVGDNGWSREMYQVWVTDALVKLLLEP